MILIYTIIIHNKDAQHKSVFASIFCYANNRMYIALTNILALVSLDGFLLRTLSESRSEEYICITLLHAWALSHNAPIFLRTTYYSLVVP